jgi:hypothetical protein
MKFETLLIVTYGRSGSTLLQGILNSIPGVLIRGENYNFAFHLYESYLKILAASEFEFAKSSESPTHSWYGANRIDIEKFNTNIFQAIRDVIIADQCGLVRTWGFKEIRYPNIGDQLGGYLDWLTMIMPNLGIIFNTRDLDDVAASGWWAKQNSESVKSKLASAENLFFDYMRNNKKISFHIRYEDIVSN